MSEPIPYFSGRAPLRCKFLAPTNGSPGRPGKGTRIRVSQFPSTFGRDPNAVTVDWVYELGHGENYVRAVSVYLERASWAGVYSVATTNEGAVAVYVPGISV